MMRAGWLAAVVAVGGCGAEAARASEAPAPVDVAIPVHVEPVTRGALSLPVRAPGTLGARHELDLSFKVGGVVSQVAVEAGTRVRKGQVLAVIDATELTAQLTSARQTLDKAERDDARVKGLHAQGTIPLVEAQNAATGLELAKANVESAAFNVHHARLVAPESGVIDRRMVSPGEVVAPGRPVFHLSTSGGGPVARVGLIDRDVLAVKLGDRATVSLDARPEHELPAHVSQVASTASAGTGTFAAELTIDDPAARELPTGLTVKVRIEHQEADALRVPMAALVEGRGHDAAVYVAGADGRAKRVPVRVRMLVQDGAVIASDGELHEVITTGASLLHDGALVRVEARAPEEER